MNKFYLIIIKILHSKWEEDHPKLRKRKTSKIPLIKTGKTFRLHKISISSKTKPMAGRPSNTPINLTTGTILAQKPISSNEEINQHSPSSDPSTTSGKPKERDSFLRIILELLLKESPIDLLMFLSSHTTSPFMCLIEPSKVTISYTETLDHLTSIQT